MKHIKDEVGEVLKLLEATNAEQDVVLRLDGREGTWTRFKSHPNGTKSTGFKCKDINARKIWDDIKVNSVVAFEVVRIIGDNTETSTEVSAATEVKSEKATTNIHQILLEPLLSHMPGKILCLGVDVAWWGGSKKTKKSRAEAIAFSLRHEGKWGKLEISLVDLNPLFEQKADEFTPNADPNAVILFEALKRIIDRFGAVDRVVVAVDVPVLAVDRGLPAPKKANAKGEKGGVYRQCDEAWMKSRAKAPAGWTGVNVLPGAPTVPRCEELLKKLRAIDFEVFGLCDTAHKFQIIECFPNEIVWSIGASGLDPGLRPDSLQQYKRLGKKFLPLSADLFHATWEGTLKRAMSLAGCDDSLISDWTLSFKTWLENSTCFDKEAGIGFTGKAFDDAVESVLSLTAAMAFVDGKAHIHSGTDPEDGHIIGPGQVKVS
ncbi:hypothetical protein N9N28_11470 [Rubripirellula amarantea]|nr:hypothetical protein [Rubripirellula amarantea]